MGTYAHVVIELENGSFVNEHDADNDITLHQNYDSFAVLTGCRNFNNVKPIIPMRDLNDSQLESLAPYIDEDRGVWTYFTPEEFRSFDFMKPLEFLDELAASADPNRRLQHRRESIHPNDTYHAHVSRETDLFEWMAAIESIQPKVKHIYVIFD